MNCPRRHVLTKQDILLGKGTWAESRRVREPRRTAMPGGIGFWVVFSQSFWLRVLPGGVCHVQPRWMPVMILGGGWTCGVSFWPFLNSSGWWWLISSVFLTRTSCRKTTHANGYYDAWPGWVVSISVLTLIYLLQYSWASLVAQLVKNWPTMRETWVQSLACENPLEKGKAIHSSILAWRIPRTV